MQGAKPSSPQNKSDKQTTHPSETVSKDNLTAKFLEGINLFSAYPMGIHAGYKILDYFLLG